MKQIRMKDKALYEALKKLVPNFEKKLRIYSDELRYEDHPHGLSLCWEVQVGPEPIGSEFRSLRLDPNMYELVEEKTNILLKLESEEDARKLYDELLKVKARSASQEDSFFKDVRSIELVGDER